MQIIKAGSDEHMKVIGTIRRTNFIRKNVLISYYVITIINSLVINLTQPLKMLIYWGSRFGILSKKI